MNYELNKKEFEKIKREELAYIDSIAQISSNKTLSETEKLEIYRTLNNYEIKEEYYAVADFKNENCKFFMER